MPERKHTLRALGAASLLVAAVGVGAIIGSPGLASAQVDTTSTTAVDDAATTTTMVDDVTGTTLDDATLDDATDGGDHQGRLHDGNGPCDDAVTEDTSSDA